jgi:hypothetical protein
MKSIVILEIYGKNKLIECTEIGTYEWYDGGLEVIDSNEYRAKKGVVEIHGAQYDDSGGIYEEWRNYYDDFGRITKSEEYSEGIVTKSKIIDYDEGGNIIGGYQPW